MARIAPSKIVAAQPRVRRGYFECRYGQLHVHNAIPPGGGFEEGTSLLCLHKSPQSGRVFEHFLSLAGRERSVYAPDTPGYGDSDAPTTRPSIGDYAAALGDFLDSMRFRQIDVLGYQTGALIATELAIARPTQIRRVILVSVPIAGEAEKEAFRRSPWPPVATEDGSHMAAEWQRTRDSLGPAAPADVVARTFADRLRICSPAGGAAAASPHGAPTGGASAQGWGVMATLQYPARERLSLITQSTLVLRPRDEFWDATQRVREALPKARCVDLPEQGAGLFDLAPEVAAEAIKDFIRG
ncbi:MAG TPA: alpha/beta hydrolase [Steroidobacteraceae bacterium]|jgi:pimeloyl-ACP methyl ester carboxylesterase